MEPQSPPQEPTQPNTQPTMQQFVQPSPLPPNSSQHNDKAVKILKNVSRSVLASGLFISIGSIISLLAVLTDTNNQAHKSLKLIASIIYVICGLLLIMQARKMKQVSADNLSSIRSSLTASLFTAIAIVVASVFVSIVGQTGRLGLAGFLSLVLVIYIMYTKFKLKTPSSNSTQS